MMPQTISGGADCLKNESWFGSWRGAAGTWPCGWLLQREGATSPWALTPLTAEPLEQGSTQGEITWLGDFTANPSRGRKVCHVGRSFLKWDLVLGRGPAPTCRSPGGSLRPRLAPRAPSPRCRCALIRPHAPASGTRGASNKSPQPTALPGSAWDAGSPPGRLCVAQSQRGGLGRFSKQPTRSARCRGHCCGQAGCLQKAGAAEQAK